MVCCEVVWFGLRGEVWCCLWGAKLRAGGLAQGKHNRGRRDGGRDGKKGNGGSGEEERRARACDEGIEGRRRHHLQESLMLRYNKRAMYDI